MSQMKMRRMRYNYNVVFICEDYVVITELILRRKKKKMMEKKSFLRSLPLAVAGLVIQ